MTKDTILKYLQSIDRTGIKNLIEWIETNDYFTAPSSTKFHNNFEGGLADHSLKVYKIYQKLNETFQRGIAEESLIIGGLLHDVCKVNFYYKDKKARKVNGKWEEYETYGIEDREPMGHGAKSIIILQRFIELKDIELYSILWHMGKPSDYSEGLAFNKALKKYPNTLLLHMADFMSGTLYEKTI